MPYGRIWVWGEKLQYQYCPYSQGYSSIKVVFRVGHGWRELLLESCVMCIKKNASGTI